MFPRPSHLESQGVAHLNDWIEGARPRTLPASLAPVIAGTAFALPYGASWPRAFLAALVALLLQIGVNYSNDYSDGIRGTDDHRQGPPRLTGGRKASPRTVKCVAFSCFSAACMVGLVLLALSGTWWLIAAGALAVLAAWYYTGGSHPYGYMGLGEIFVFVFFGLMATVGTTYTQVLRAPWQAWLGACAIGLLACAILMVNNIRDIPTDALAGKHTLAVRLGESGARLAYCLMLVLPFAALPGFLPGHAWWTVLSFLPAAAISARAIWIVGVRKERGLALIGSLRDTGFSELFYALALLLTFAC